MPERATTTRPRKAALLRGQASDAPRLRVVSSAPPAPKTRRTTRKRRPAKDPFGYDPQLHAQVRPLSEFFYRRYWRIQTEGLEHVPATGPVLVVGNHSGGIPLDATMVVAALDLDHPQHRLLRFLYDKFVAGMPFVGDFYNRMGAVVASYDNARTLLQRGEAVGLFPEGVEGLAKGLGRRYQLQRFRTGFIRLSLELNVPIVPVAIVGAEETYPVIAKWYPTVLSKLLNIPYVPVTPLFPFLGPLGVVPLPTRWHIRFGEPLHPYRHAHDPTDRRTANRLSEQVRRRIQQMLHELLAERTSMF